MNRWSYVSFYLNVAIAALLISVIASVVITLSSVKAVSYDWTKDDIVLERNVGLSDNVNDYGNGGACTNQTVQLPNDYGHYREIEHCIFQAKSFNYTIYEGRMYVNLSGDGNAMFPVAGTAFASNSYVVPIPNSDSMIFASNYYRDIPSKIEFNENLDAPGYFELPDFKTTLSSDEIGVDHNVLRTSVSNNGKWIVLSFKDIGYVRIDSETMEATWIGQNRSPNEFFTISNDGVSFVAVTWGYDPVRIYSIGNCGVRAAKLQNSWFEQSHPRPCVPRDLNELINKALDTGSFTSPAIPVFDDAGTRLTLYVYPNNKGGEGVYLKIKNTAAQPSLDYLAMGDSYSSGEGDVGINDEGWPYYTHQTRGEGGCHVSSRSYPFLLKEYNKLDDNRVASVACSGARVSKDYYGSTDSYNGQSDQLKDFTDSERKQATSGAMTTFNPGILKQLEFVKTHQPKAVTLTGGGNDVGFSNVIKSCIGLDTGNKHKACEEAVDGSTKRIALGDAIATQYEEMKNLIASIKQASANTTIYVVGYPTFLSDASKGCANALFLNERERKAINSGVGYMNDVLEAASKSAGAHFVDIEDSLHGGRICEGSKYMTGVLSRLSGVESAQMFHPNSTGHTQMALAIHSKGFKPASGANPAAVQVDNPQKPAAFGNLQPVKTYRKDMVKDGVLKSGLKHSLRTAVGEMFKLKDRITFTLHSDPIQLGAFTVSNTQEFTAELYIPAKTPLGVHMLIAEIESQDGSLSRYYQYVEVHGPLDDDRDADGVVDSEDQCLFIQRWYDETSGQDLCKVSSSKRQGKGHKYGHYSSNGLHLGHGLRFITN